MHMSEWLFVLGYEGQLAIWLMASFLLYTLASQIVWSAADDGQLFVKVRHYDWTIYGADTGYKVVVNVEE